MISQHNKPGDGGQEPLALRGYGALDNRDASIGPHAYGRHFYLEITRQEDTAGGP